jgi:DNA-binding beta-propeller fold protein YncE
MNRARVALVAVACAVTVIALGRAGYSQAPSAEKSGARRASAPARETPPLRLVQEITLPGVEGRLDHFTIDAKRKRVIFSALGNNSVEVVDAFAGRRIKSIPDLAQPQGVLYLAEGDKIFVANAADGKVKVFNGTTFALTDTIDFGEDPDNLRYDAAAKRVYVGYGEGAIGAIDATTNKRLANVDFKLEAHPEGFQLETKGPRIFVNMADKKNIAVIDRSTGKVTTWALPGLDKNFPMALDEAHGRVFIGTRRPSRMVVLDMATGKIVANLNAAGDMDDLFYDAARSRIYVAGGEGYVSVFQQKDPDHYESMGRFASSIGCRTGTWYVSRDRLYLAAPPHRGGGAALLVFEPQD